MSYLCQEQRRHKDKRRREYEIPYPSDALSWLLGRLVGQKVQHHRGPAGITAPSPPEQQRPENLSHRIVDRRRFKHAGKQVIPEPFDLHILPADQPQIHQHIQPHQELHRLPRVPVIAGVQEHSQRQRNPDVTEVEQVEQIILGQPQRHRHRLKQRQKQD